MESVTIGELGATWIVLGGAVVAALTYIVTRALVRRKIIGKIDFMSDALDSGESAFRYSEDHWSDRRLKSPTYVSGSVISESCWTMCRAG